MVACVCSFGQSSAKQVLGSRLSWLLDLYPRKAKVMGLYDLGNHPIVLDMRLVSEYRSLRWYTGIAVLNCGVDVDGTPRVKQAMKR